VNIKILLNRERCSGRKSEIQSVCPLAVVGIAIVSIE